jgi:hypothetical protein
MLDPSTGAWQGGVELKQRMSAIWMSGLLAALLLLNSSGCSRTLQSSPTADSDLVVNLRWVKSYPGEPQSKVSTGLFWALSFLGARLPADGAVLSWHGSIVSVDLDAAGVAETSKAAWKKLLNTLKSSAEYRMMGGIDIGRFILLSLCSSHQYYALTGVSRTYEEFRAKHEFAPRHAAIVESGVAHGNRLVELEKGDSIKSVAFVAYEGSGALRDHSFQKADIETLDIMENGQLRFGLYDLEGHLKEATTPALTAAGKPSKCLWCHEINLQPPFRNVTDLEGFYSTKEFAELVANARRIIASYRTTLASKVDFKRLDDHSDAEDLYLSFVEPTASRLAAEWNIRIDDVQQLLASRNLKTHPHDDHIGDGVLGDDLYDRNDVDALAPYATIRGPSDMREASSYEPNLVK